MAANFGDDSMIRIEEFWVDILITDRESASKSNGGRGSNPAIEDSRISPEYCDIAQKNHKRLFFETVMYFDSNKFQNFN